jgi:hypothetical protein
MGSTYSKCVSVALVIQIADSMCCVMLFMACPALPYYATLCYIISQTYDFWKMIY